MPTPTSLKMSNGAASTTCFSLPTTPRHVLNKFRFIEEFYLQAVVDCEIAPFRDQTFIPIGNKNHSVCVKYSLSFNVISIHSITDRVTLEHVGISYFFYRTYCHKRTCTFPLFRQEKMI